MTATQVQFRRGTAAQNDAFTGAIGELTIDTTNFNVRVHDGSTAGGFLVGGFASGTKMLFQQTAAPTGWTKQTTHNDKALRIVSGTVSSGGTDAFSSAFGSSVTTGTHSLTSGENGQHTHSASGSLNVGAGGVGGGNPATGANADTSVGVSVSVTNSGSGTGHSHTLNMDLQYVDFIIAQKD